MHQYHILYIWWIPSSKETLIHDFIPRNQTNNLGLAKIVLTVRVVCLYKC